MEIYSIMSALYTERQSDETLAEVFEIKKNSSSPAIKHGGSNIIPCGWFSERAGQLPGIKTNVERAKYMQIRPQSVRDLHVGRD